VSPGEHFLHDVLREMPVAGEDDRVTQETGQAGHREFLEGHTPKTAAAAHLCPARMKFLLSHRARA
jgi:hypothetical protein